MNKPTVASKPASEITVCVTGASGFVASHIVRELLARGHVVRATVRDPSDDAKTAHLRQIAERLDASDRLRFFRGDLLEPGSFDEAIAGCDVVCHTAAVARFNARDPQREIVDPSVQGVRNVLGSIRRSGSVSRVVHTSSIAAVMRYGDAKHHVFDEDDWNTEATLASDPYGLAKTEAERELWRAREQGETPAFDLLTLQPGLVLGEVFTRAHLRSSTAFVAALLNGQYPGIPPIPFSVVDVRDVAEAHANAVSSPEVAGRFLLVAEGLWMADIARVLTQSWPKAKIPRRNLPWPLLYISALFDKRMSWSTLRQLVNNPVRFNNRRSRELLGIRYRPVDESIRETARSMLERGFVHIKGR